MNLEKISFKEIQPIETNYRKFFKLSETEKLYPTKYGYQFFEILSVTEPDDVFSKKVGHLECKTYR